MDLDVAAAAASPASASESEPWARDPPSTSSQHDSYSYHSRSSRRASNRVKPKPASPHVISSILSSLEDTLAPLPATAADYPSETASRLSHSDSISHSVVSSASVHRIASSPGFGVEYGNHLALDDEDGLSGAALPPTIPTSRSPSGLSKYTSKRHSSFSKPTAAATAPSHHRTDSRRSSFSATSTDRPGSRRNYLSSESWVRRNADGDARPEEPRGRSPRKSLRRVSSQEALRSPARGYSPEPTPEPIVEPPSVSLAEKIIARTPPPLSISKGRLFLNDTTINEDLTFESPVTPWTNDQSPVAERGLGIERQGSYDSQLPVGEAQFPKVSGPIIDSIPTRTSSLRQKGNSPAARKKKGKKSKSKSPGAPSITPETMAVKQSSPSIQDSSWIDLGEDDETVRRIKELRERRKSRLQESTTDPSSFEYHAGEAQAYELPTAPNKATRPDVPVRSHATRALTEPKNNQRLPGERDEITVLGNGGVVAMNDDREMPRNLESKRSLSVHRSIRSDISPLPTSMDYSYARAMDILGSEESFERDNGASFDRASSEVVTPTKSNSLAPPPNTTSAKKSKRSPSDRWTVGHPDVPSDFDKKKSRRKSMNDARHIRTVEEQEAITRRDSIENAVEQYLSAPRLSRKIKNARSGRSIAFSEVGDPNGAAVFICVGMGLTRYVTAFFDELATTLRLRLITLDRPGVGGSEPLPATDKSGPLGWPEDLLTVCQHLGIVNFSILAHSAGAIYALATALIVPHLIKGKIHLLAPWVPPSQLGAISHPTASAPPSNALPRSQRFLRALPTPFLKAANASFMTATSASLKPATKRTTRSNTTRTPPRRTNGGEDTYVGGRTSGDRPEYKRRESMMLMDQYMPETHPLENFPISGLEEGEHDASMKRGSLVLSATASPMDPGLAYATNGLNAAEHAERERQMEYTSQLTHRTWDLATRDSNPATDLVVCLERTRDVGFQYTDVGREVVITHGSEDKRVPVANVQWLAEQMNRRALGHSVDGRESRESWAEATTRGGCEVRVLPGEGHGLMASPIIMGDVLTEIASYWAGSRDKGRL